MQGNCLDDSEQWSQHAVQSIVWSAAGTDLQRWISTLFDTDTGCEKLAVIEENIVTAFNETGGDCNDVITVTLNRTYRVRVISHHQGIS
jgi:anaphase-promoting complex subunit 5